MGRQADDTLRRFLQVDFMIQVIIKNHVRTARPVQRQQQKKGGKMC